MKSNLGLLGFATLIASEMLSVASAQRLYADDTIPSIARGGIEFRTETPISLEKESLTISLERIVAEYDFVNPTDAGVSAEALFPNVVRECSWTAGDSETSRYSPGFQLWVSGTPQEYRTETIAFVKNRDLTAVLRHLGIDIANCGNYQDERSEDLSKLSRQDLSRIISLGLVSSDGKMPLWTVHQSYNWTVNFPEGRALHIKLAYTPGFGESEQIAVKYLDSAERKKNHVVMRELDTGCLSTADARRIMHEWGGPSFEDASGYVSQWVDFVLANHWMVKDFELNVQEPSDGWWVGFCWNRNAERLSPNHVRVKAQNFMPARNLHILFLPTRSAESR